MTLRSGDVFGLAHPGVDAHTLGLSVLAQLLRDLGYEVYIAGAAICDALNHPARLETFPLVRSWILENRITRLGFSYRLDPDAAAEIFGRLMYQLDSASLLKQRGGPIASVYFAGLPAACARVELEHSRDVLTFCGDETPRETLLRLGVPASRIAGAIDEQISYDDMRLEFGRRLLESEAHRAVKPPNRRGYHGFGTAADSLLARVEHARRLEQPPLMRAHVGPYLPDREQAIKQFLEWTQLLAKSGFLDVLSVGSSQLTQSNFGEDWQGMPNGGGVPINSPREFEAVWSAARPMLVRTYAGTRNLPELAAMYEQTIHNAWHTFSLWWFCQIDGRGPLPMRENLRQHSATLDLVAKFGKPYEPNIPHHFSFRGADDVTYVASAVIAARAAQRRGIRTLVLQNMLNTPKYTWGVQDLAKARAMLQLVRELENGAFRVLYQPRAGLDYFSPNLERAKAQLAAVTALMDDVEAGVDSSPDIIHVVSYPEGSHLASPPEVDESVAITIAALREYRLLRSKGEISDMLQNQDVKMRTEQLVNEVQIVLDAIERRVPNYWEPEGLYQIFRSGFLPVPYLWECREEMRQATRWQTRVIKGSVKVVDDLGMPIPVAERCRQAAEAVEGPGRSG